MKVGIICDLSFTKHIGIRIYYDAIKNLFGEVKLVKCIGDLQDLEILFIGNEHFQPHRDVWQQDLFQRYCNFNDIKVVAFSAEKIYNSSFPGNETIQKNLEKFNFLYQYTYDVEDCGILETKLFRPCISKKYIDVEKNSEKIDKCVFLGNLNCHSYKERTDTLEEIKKTVEVVFAEKQNTWYDYIKEISKYKYILSPLGNANGLNLRFYEILLVNSIPIQQVKDDTLKFYDLESQFTDCIFFKTSKDLKNKFNNFSSQKSINNIFLEDHIQHLLLEDGLMGSK